MKVPSMFKTPQYKSFNFKTRYYDAEKEAFEERLQAAKAEAGLVSAEAEAVKTRIRNHFDNKRNSRNHYSSKKSNIRVIIIIAILAAISFWLLK